MSSPIPLAMVGMLIALPGTALWRRLDAEGRLRTRTSGDQFERTNFETKLDEKVMLRGYAGLLKSIYSRDAYYDRVEKIIRLAPQQAARRRVRLADLGILMRTVLFVGILSKQRWRYWRLIAVTLLRAPHAFSWAIAGAIRGEHLVRYTEETLVPRLEAAVREVERERFTKPADIQPLAPSEGVWAPPDPAPALREAAR